MAWVRASALVGTARPVPAIRAPARWVHGAGVAVVRPTAGRREAGDLGTDMEPVLRPGTDEQWMHWSHRVHRWNTAEVWGR